MELLCGFCRHCCDVEGEQTQKVPKAKDTFLVADQTQILPLLNMKHMKVLDADPTVAVGSTPHLFLSSVRLI